MSVEELEAPTNFAHLDSLADAVFEAEITAGTSVDLSLARDHTGTSFAGIDQGHTWLVALNCGICDNPAPWYMTVLRPCSAAN